MPRRPRIHLDGVPLHVVQRGHNRTRCFFDASDYRSYLHWLSCALEQTQCALHAYALMPNHVHLLVTPSAAHAVPRLLMSLGRHYVQYVNRKYRRTGTLWDSRYKSSVIDSARYLIACQRYIELNPVRASLVAEPAESRWSSYRANALGYVDALLTPHSIYRALGSTSAEQKVTYRELFAGAVEESEVAEIRRALHQSQPLGDATFTQSVDNLTGIRRDPKRRGRPCRTEIRA
jgi:putative transposase